jgi:hypothetical protein
MWGVYPVAMGGWVCQDGIYIYILDPDKSRVKGKYDDEWVEMSGDMIT